MTSASPLGLQLEVDWSACTVVLLDSSNGRNHPMQALDAAALVAAAADDDDGRAADSALGAVSASNDEVAITTTFRLVYQGLGCFTQCPPRRFAFVHNPKNWAFPPRTSTVEVSSTDTVSGDFQRQQEEFTEDCKGRCADVGADCMAIFISHDPLTDAWVCRGLKTIGSQLYRNVNGTHEVSNSYVKQKNGYDVVPANLLLFQELERDAGIAERSGETTTAAAEPAAAEVVAPFVFDGSALQGPGAALFDGPSGYADPAPGQFAKTVLPYAIVMGALLLVMLSCWCRPRCCCGRDYDAFGCNRSCWSCCCRNAVVHRSATAQLTADNRLFDAHVRRHQRAGVQQTAAIVAATGDWTEPPTEDRIRSISSLSNGTEDSQQTISDDAVMVQAPHLRQMLASAAKRANSGGGGGGGDEAGGARTPEPAHKPARGSPRSSSPPNLPTVAEDSANGGNQHMSPRGVGTGSGVLARTTPSPPHAGVTSSATRFTAEMQSGEDANYRPERSNSFKGAALVAVATHRLQGGYRRGSVCMCTCGCVGVYVCACGWVGEVDRDSRGYTHCMHADRHACLDTWRS